MKSSEAIMEILEAYDLTGSLRAAAAMAGCGDKTVAHYVALRDAGQCPDERPRRPMAIDPFLDKVVVCVQPHLVSVSSFVERVSDVNVASHLLVDILDQKVDAAIVMSNDSDLKLPLEEAPATGTSRGPPTRPQRRRRTS